MTSLRVSKELAVLLPIVFACYVSPSVAQDARGPSLTQPQPDEVTSESQGAPEQTIRRALDMPIPEGPHLAARAYDALFLGAAETRLRRLAADSNPSIALQARWELRHTRQKPPFDTEHPDYIPGFAEGEFGLRLPMPWAVEFALSWYDNGEQALEFYRRVGFAGMREKSRFTIEGKELSLNTVRLAPDLHRTSYGPLAARNVEIAKAGKAIAIQVDGRMIHVPEGDFLQETRLAPNRYLVAALVNEERGFVAICEEGRSPGWLICVDLSTMQVAWRSAMWAWYADFHPPMSGTVYSDIQLTSSGGKIAVFGRGTHSPFFIECFDARTGKNQLRFSSRYWDCRNEAARTD